MKPVKIREYKLQIPLETSKQVQALHEQYLKHVTDQTPKSEQDFLAMALTLGLQALDVDLQRMKLRGRKVLTPAEVQKLKEIEK